jgi:hypothetical protein
MAETVISRKTSPSQLNARSSASTALAFGRKPGLPPLRVSFRPWQNEAGTVLGFCRIECPSGLIIDGAKLMLGPRGARWLAMPATKQLRPDGKLVLLANGKQAWSASVDFRDRETRERFQEKVLEVLRRQHPALFAGSEITAHTAVRARPGPRKQRLPLTDDPGADLPDDDVRGLWREEIVP